MVGVPVACVETPLTQTCSLTDRLDYETCPFALELYTGTLAANVIHHRGPPVISAASPSGIHSSTHTLIHSSTHPIHCFQRIRNLIPGSCSAKLDSTPPRQTPSPILLHALAVHNLSLLAPAPPAANVPPLASHPPCPLHLSTTSSPIAFTVSL
jgi:hypothetical protein